jgi:hypothetical protein
MLSAKLALDLSFQDSLVKSVLQDLESLLASPQALHAACQPMQLPTVSVYTCDLAYTCELAPLLLTKCVFINPLWDTAACVHGHADVKLYQLPGISVVCAVH